MRALRGMRIDFRRGASVDRPEFFFLSDETNLKLLRTLNLHPYIGRYRRNSGFGNRRKQWRSRASSSDPVIFFGGPANRNRSVRRGGAGNTRKQVNGNVRGINARCAAFNAWRGCITRRASRRHLRNYSISIFIAYWSHQQFWFRANRKSGALRSSKIRRMPPRRTGKVYIINDPKEGNIYFFLINKKARNPSRGGRRCSSRIGARLAGESAASSVAVEPTSDLSGRSVGLLLPRRVNRFFFFYGNALIVRGTERNFSPVPAPEKMAHFPRKRKQFEFLPKWP